MTRGRVLLFLLAGLLVLGLIRWIGGAEETLATPSPSATASASPSVTVAPSPSPSVTASPSPSQTGSDDHSAEPADRAAWTPTAVRFTEVYLSGADDWLAPLTALSTPSLAEGLSSTDPSRVPTGEIAESEVITDTYGGGGVMRFTLDTRTALDVTVVLDAIGSPKVADIGPAS